MSAVLVKKQPLRYTPTGVPVIELVLKHSSIQMDGSKPRAVEMQLDAVSIGEVARKIGEVPLGQEIDVTGFLAPRNKMSAILVLHINELVNRSSG